MSSRPEPLYDKPMTCPFCAFSFSTKRVRKGGLIPVRRDSDFCMHVPDPLYHPLVYAVAVCPCCGFAFTDSFAAGLSAPVRQRVEREIADRWTPKDLGGVRSYAEAEASYKLALFAAEVTEQTHSVKGGLSLRLAWLYRFHVHQEEQRFLRLAACHFEQAYLHEDLRTEEMSEVQLLYLIGELHRRTGRPEQAIHYFSRVTAMKGKTGETGILRMAREQWALAREEHGRQKGEAQNGGA